MKKRILSIVLALAMAAVFLPLASSTVSDLASASPWARSGITSAISRGFVPLDLQSNYQSVITRKEFALLAVYWVECVLEADIDTILTERDLSRNPNAFTDTNDSDILAAYALGITSGVGNNQFNPSGSFTRQQAATMLMNIIRVIEPDIIVPPASGFADIAAADSWARPGINFVRAGGIMSGTGNNNFSPHRTFTRQESIVTFNNIERPESMPENYTFRTHSTGARHIVIGVPFEHYFDSRHQSIDDNPNVTNPETAQLELDNVRRTEQEHNVFIEFINMTWDGMRERIPLSILSGAPSADVFFGEGSLVVPPIFNNMATPLESLGLTQEDFNDERVFSYLRLPSHTRTYLFRPAEIFQTMYMIGYNRDMIAEAGLADPQTLWERDEWTWEIFREYCRVLTDPARNIYGWSGYWTNLLQGLLFSNNAAFAPGPVQTLDHPNTLEVLEFIHTLYNVDRAARPWNPDDWTINNRLYAQGLSAFWIANTWLNNEQGGGFGTEGHHIELPFEFGMIPFPVGPQGNRDTNYAVNVSAANFYFIPRFIENARQVFDVMYDFTNWFNYDFDLRDDVEWVANSVATEENLRFYLEVAGRGGFDLLFNLDLGSIHVETIIQHTTHAAEATPAQYVATWAPVFQAALDRYFGN